ncbi:ornithine carbamoyltransferase [Exophiala aquamarina CBS 119918]|uniref:Ornithine carbamoyltransferase, mitochondrial n=1 Tax=Exophiala aquamarina CBS 119918 TaxID=1182545 RepID=A0A072P9C3_9EURO|nr:ornithine carbamoyltransferase [Exophiala aquamarina CBS 119918]KEF55863.1 ornithine carbamoyltransferase [Exophiala aquamarina CBS 119918]
MPALRPLLRSPNHQVRRLASSSTSTSTSLSDRQSPIRRTSSWSSQPPRHLLSISDLTDKEFAHLVDNATIIKGHYKSRSWPLRSALSGQTIALMFSKLSTRTRVSSEGAIVAMGGHPMFLGKNDIQLGVNESLYDTSVVISSMVSGIVARVGPHADIAALAKDSSVPVISGLCDTYHPLQAIADFATMAQTLPQSQMAKGLRGKKIAWVGDANNVLHDLCIGARKLGVDVAVATPEGYGLSQKIKDEINAAGDGELFETTVPEEAVKGADFIITDTWISMGQEEEKAKRLAAFAGYTVTEDLARRGGASTNWQFLHCLPRHQEEVDDEVFYGGRSLVFPEAQNRLFAAISAMEAFFVRPGTIRRHVVGPVFRRVSHGATATKVEGAVPERSG